MEKTTVFSLIKKFEQLSNEMTKPKVVLVRQKSTNANPILKRQESVGMVTEQVFCTRSPHLGLGYNPLGEVEQKICVLKEHISDITGIKQDDEKMLLGLFMEMMDLLIHLSSIDTDGLKPMKVKKDCCLMELKNMKNDLKVLIGIGDRSENVPTDITREPKANKYKSNEELRQLTDDDSSMTATPISSMSSSQPNIKEMHLDLGSDGRIQSVHSLTKMFESNRSLNIQSTPTTPNQKASRKFSSLAQSLDNFPTDPEDNDEEFENDDDDDDVTERTKTQSCNSNRSSPTLMDELLSELSYYKDIVNELDPDDFIRMESVEEYLMEIAPLVEECEHAKKEVRDLLMKLEILKSGQRIDEAQDEETLRKDDVSEQRSYQDRRVWSGTILEEAEDEEESNDLAEITNEKALLRDLQKQCKDFLFAEKNSAVILTQGAKLRENDELNEINMEAPLIQLQNDNNDDAASPEKLPNEDPTIRILEINIPDDDEVAQCSYAVDDLLAVSLRKLEDYKQLIRVYLEYSTAVIIEQEEDIQIHYDDLISFAPHDDVKEQFVELCDGYKELLDLITEAKFSQTFNSTIDNSNEDDMNRDVALFNSMANLTNLTAEIEKYHALIDGLDPRDPVKADVLRENLHDVAAELDESDALPADKLQPMKDIEELQRKLADKCQQQND